MNPNGAATEEDTDAMKATEEEETRTRAAATLIRTATREDIHVEGEIVDVTFPRPLEAAVEAHGMEARRDGSKPEERASSEAAAARAMIRYVRRLVKS